MGKRMYALVRAADPNVLPDLETFAETYHRLADCAGAYMSANASYRHTLQQGLSMREPLKRAERLVDAFPELEIVAVGSALVTRMLIGKELEAKAQERAAQPKAKPDFVTDEMLRIMDGTAAGPGHALNIILMYGHRTWLRMTFRGMTNEQADQLWNYWAELRGIQIPN